VNATAAGAILGLGVGAGAVIAVRSAPPMRHLRLVDRLAPYLLDAPPSPLLTVGAPRGPVAVLRMLFGPLASDVVARLDRLAGGPASVRRRLDGLSSARTVEDFRLAQLMCAGGAMLAGALLALAADTARGSIDPVLVGAVSLAGLVAGVLGMDVDLSRRLARRNRLLLAELPVVADLLALAVAAGEAPAQALDRVCRCTGGELARDFADALARCRTGTALAASLDEIAARTTLEPLQRFVTGFATAVERGTPLAELLRAQALDARAASTRALLDAGGVKEISMMVPVVFLILPVTVLFVLYPGLLTLTSVAH
jgi:tight adherence protein C